MRQEYKLGFSSGVEKPAAGGDVLSVGGVRPRCPVPGTGPRGVLVSALYAGTEEVDLSGLTGLLENNRLKAEPTLEERVWVLRVSPVSKAIRIFGVIAILGRCYG